MIYFIIVYLILLIIYSIYLPKQLEHFKLINNCPWAVPDAVCDVINNLEQGIENIAHSIISPITNKVEAIGDLFKHLFKIMTDIKDLIFDGFKLLKDVINQTINIAELLYLILNKMSLCYHGFKEVYDQSNNKLSTIKVRIEQLKINIENCSKIVLINPLHFSESREKFKESYESCIAVYKANTDEIKSIVDDFHHILNNANLFAQENDVPGIGKSSSFCKNGIKDNELSKDFSNYSKQCNQCFNMDGILGKGFDELNEVIKLIPIAEDVIREVEDMFSLFSKLDNDLHRIF